jgi:capsular polysaccharide biosynthesis protein
MASQNELALRKRWWVVVIAVVVGVAGAFVSLLIVNPEYQASCKLFVAGRPDSGTGEGYQAAQFAQARIAAYLDLIKGARVAEGAINTLGLSSSTQDLQSRISANAAAESVVMTVSVIDRQPQRSADLVNAVCQSFLAVVADAEGANPLVNVRIVEYAKAPEHRIGPNKKRYLSVGGLTGLLAGLGLAVALGRREPKNRQLTGADMTDAGALEQFDSPPQSDDGPGERSSGAGFHRRRSG